ncbi:retrovirus-related pol polyprotein from transposon TNT 1-94 [Tanacetum coccineum]
MTIIGTKWVFRNKLDENGIVSRNKARLVAQGYNQQEGIDYDETCAPVARLESIRILLAYACSLDFKLFQMDIKSAFQNSFINEEVYVAQPSGFIDFEKPDHVYKLKKALYGLKQAPKACSIMHDEFEMSMMGELNFFLGLQIKQMEDGIFFNQSKYIKEMLKKFGLEESKPIKTPMSSDTKLTKDEECESVDSTKYRGMIGTTHLGLWYPKGTSIETVVYADSDHAGDYVDRKSTSGICMFVGCCLTSWFSKKQTALAISTTKAEYVSAGKACQQALWMKQALIDYDVTMPRITGLDHQNNASHDGLVVSQNFENMNYINPKFESIGFVCLLKIKEKIVPRFVLEFYSQLNFNYSSEGHLVVSFVIQNTPFSFTLEVFGDILGIPSKGHCSDKWSLDYLEISCPSKGCYQTTPPTPSVIKTLIQVPRQGQVTRVHNKKTINVDDNEILNHEIQHHMSPWVEIIGENVLCLGGHRDHVSACLSHIRYYIESSNK